MGDAEAEIREVNPVEKQATAAKPSQWQLNGRRGKKKKAGEQDVEYNDDCDNDGDEVWMDDCWEGRDAANEMRRDAAEE